MKREEAIVILDGFKHNPLFNEQHFEALDMAIASLKTDEAYQLEYENRDFIEIPEGMTNGEVIRALFPNINEYKFNSTWWNAPYKSEKPETCKGCLEPCIMYEPDMRGCNKKVREVSE